MAPDELEWDYTDLTYIPFQNWAVGLEMLLKKLRSINAPRPLTVEEGRQLVAKTFLPQHLVVEREEPLYSNCFAFERIPERLHVLEWTGRRSTKIDALPVVWPYYEVGENRVISFALPPREVRAKQY